MKDDKLFLADFARSQTALSRFIDIQSKQGVNMVSTPSELRGDSKDRRKFADNGDGTLTMRFEHKKRKTNAKFTCKDDYPYPDMIVDEVYNYEQKTTPWIAYFIENEPGTHVAVIWNFTRHYWFTKTLFDPYQKRKGEFYLCPTRFIWFSPIDEIFVR